MRFSLRPFDLIPGLDWTATLSSKSRFASQVRSASAHRIRGSSQRSATYRVLAKAQGKLVTVLGKGGAGKTTVAIVLAKVRTQRSWGIVNT
eukprot:1065522-Prorocentrum_minimum.AAC.4